MEAKRERVRSSPRLRRECVVDESTLIHRLPTTGGRGTTNGVVRLLSRFRLPFSKTCAAKIWPQYPEEPVASGGAHVVATASSTRGIKNDNDCPRQRQGVYWARVRGARDGGARGLRWGKLEPRAQIPHSRICPVAPHG